MLAVFILATSCSLLRASEVYSVQCSEGDGGGQPPASCVLRRGDSASADATGRFYDEVLKTGWGRLFIRAPSHTRSTAFAVGYLEGALTAEHIVKYLAIYKSNAGLDPVPAGVQTFAETSDAWSRAKIAAADPEDRYWSTVRFSIEQMDGMMAGANSQLEPGKHLTNLDKLLLSLSGDIDDIKSATDAKKKIDIESMTAMELTSWQQSHGHCSALVKMLPDGSDIFVGHNTWWNYVYMNRIFKRYEFGDFSPVAMSSYPGVPASVDDFYHLQNLVVTETTLTVFDKDLLGNASAHALPFWIRAMVANFIAKSGPEWMTLFERHNGGTYNNQWIVVDYSKFTPGEPLPEGTLTIGEQLPGYFHWEDQTRILSYGYWPSYNVALYPETALLAGQTKVIKQKGAQFSYQESARATVFRRDAGKVVDDESMQRVMRYNRFQTDPLARGNPCNQIACRKDLASNSQSAFGAIDGKYTSFAHHRAGQTVVVSGPTHDDQPVFDWASAPAGVKAALHVGTPDRFDFGWFVMGAAMNAAAAPWQATEGPGDKAARGVEVAAWPLCIIATCGAVFYFTRSWYRGSASKDTHSAYQNMGPDVAAGKGFTFSLLGQSHWASPRSYLTPSTCASSAASPPNNPWLQDVQKLLPSP